MGTCDDNDDTILYCLKDKCMFTAPAAIPDDWTQDEDRYWRVFMGRVPAMAGPYCNPHKEEVRNARSMPRA